MTNNLNKKIKLELLARKAAGYLAIFGCFFVFSYFLNKTIDAAFITICYAGMRWMFPKTFHTKTALCIMLSILSMCFCIYNALGVSVSILCNCIIALALDYVLWRVQDYIDLLNRYSKDMSKYGFSGRTQSFAEDWLLNKLSDKELMTKHEIYSVNTLNSKKRFIKRKIREYNSKNHTK